MKKAKEYVNETGIAVLMLVVLFFLLNPMDVLMLSMVEMSLVISLAVLFILFAGLIWKEASHDEREEYHRLRAGRYGYLVGLTVAVVGIVYQASQHILDPWLVYVLSGMIIAKVFAHIVNKSRF